MTAHDIVLPVWEALWITAGNLLLGFVAGWTIHDYYRLGRQRRRRRRDALVEERVRERELEREHERERRGDEQ